MKTLRRTWILVIAFVVIISQKAFAVPPPDFIIQLASQVAGFFAVAVAVLSGVVITIHHFVKNYLKNYIKLFWILCIGGVVVVSWIGAKIYDSYYQRVEQAKMTAERIEESMQVNAQALREEQAKEQEDTQRNQLIMEYLSTRYPDAIIDFRGVSLSGTAYVVEYILVQGTHNIRHQDSFSLSGENIVTYQGKIIQRFEKEESSLSITNEDFQQERKTDTGSTVLDAREDVEYEYGRYPGALHMRGADIENGGYKTLPKDKKIYVICWSGIRGKEVAEFLQKKGYQAKFLESGADGWVSFGGVWEGKIKFLDVYTGDKWRLVFSKQDMQTSISQGVKLVDVRSSAKFSKKHIENSISLPLQTLSKERVDHILRSLGSGEKYISICDDYVNCFYAKIIGVYLEKQGNTFLGRYNKPWEF